MSKNIFHRSGILKRRLTIGIIFIIAISIIAIMTKGLMILINQFHLEDIPKISKGVMVIDNKTFEKEDNVILNGEWSFYPYVFLEPDAVASYQGNQRYLLLPSIWKDKAVGNVVMGKSGYGTYQLKLINKGKPEKIMLYFTASPAEAYKVYINNKECFEVGKVGENLETTKAEYRTELIELDLEKELMITLHVSNFSFDEGGYYKPIIMGQKDDIMKLKIFNLSKDVFVLGILTMFFLYFSLIWLKSRHTRYAVSCFILVSLLSIMYVIANNEMLIRDIIPQLPFRIYNMMFYMLCISGGTLYILLLGNLFPDETSGSITKVTILKALILLVVNIALPRHFIGKVAGIQNMLAVLEFLYGIYVLSKAIYYKREGAVYILFGTMVLVSAIIYDVLYLYAMVISPYGLIGPFALAIFILCFTVIVSRRYESSYQEIESLSTRLTEMDKIKDEFLANTSHELRTPVNSMIAVTKALLEGGKLLNHEQKQSLDIIISSGSRLKNLINDLLDYSSMRHGQIKLVKSVLDIQATIENTIKELYPLMNHKKIQLSHELDKRISPIYGDKYRLIQVAYNLIQNAIKFTPEGGKIHITAYEEDKQCCISIADTGIGIPDEKLKLIFKSFEQADPSVVEKYGGMGLGLSISKEIILAHGGDIIVESKEGYGSTFTMVLPLMEQKKILERPFDKNQNTKLQPMQKNIEQESTIYIKGQSEALVIIIDDYYPNIFAAASILKTEGYSIKGFVDAEEGLNEILNNPNVVVGIIDLMMPKLSGEDLCRKIRQKYDLLQLPILVLTARVQLRGLIKSFESGANDFLQKPFEAEELRARVHTLTQLKTIKEKAIENELSMLQAQINPHFLYNTMNSIAACCYEDGEKAANIIIDLADYLRYSFELEQKKKEIPLSKELELVKVYLAIEKIRFDEKLEYAFDFKDEVLVTIPPFALQTLVENAVRHGIRKKLEGGKILIKGYMKKPYYIIEIQDTGIGITPEDLELILAGEKSTGTGLGLANVQQRLNQIYGTNMQINSTYGQGTTVTIQLVQNQEITRRESEKSC